MTMQAPARAEAIEIAHVATNPAKILSAMRDAYLANDNDVYEVLFARLCEVQDRIMYTYDPAIAAWGRLC